MKAPPNGFVAGSEEGERKGVINSELWHACAGPLVSLPPVGSLVVYFPQGHSEQVAASLQKGIDCIPSYPNLPSKLICMLHNVTLHADGETDEVYAQMTLQPVSKYDKEALLASDLGLKQNRQPSEFFCKTLTASDTSTHGGFSVPRRAAEKIFPLLDFSMQPPAQELVARDLHNNAWRFRHIYRGQPKRHLLTTGWSVFVSTKRLFAGDSVLFIRDEKSQLLLGIRHANRQQPALSSSVISSDSMHIGILAAAAHAAANNSPFTIFYNPRASPSEFVIPLAKYNKAMYTQVSLGMRFRMMFETEESGVRRYMGTITAMSDLDPIRWKDSQWRNLQVGWDESTTGERPSRVSIWDIEPVVTPFYICPPPFFRPKFSNSAGMPDDDMPWIGDDFGVRDSSIFPGMSLVQWMSMQHNNQFPSAQSKFISSMVSSASLHNNLSADNPSKLLSFQDPVLAAHSLHLNKANQHNQVSQFRQTSPAWPQQQQLHQTPVNPPQLQTQQHQPPPPSQQQQQPEQQLQQHLLRQQQQDQQQQVLQPALANNGVASKQTIGQNSQQAVMMPQLQQHHLRNGNMQPQQNIHVSDRNLFQLTSLPQDLQFHHVEQQSGLLQRHQIQQMQSQQPPNQLLQHGFPQRPQAQPQLQQSPEHNLSESQIQLQALQKLQQQQQQSLPPASPHLQPQPSQQLDNQQHHQLQKLPLYHQQQQQLISTGFSTPSLMQQQLPHVPMTQSQVQHSKAHVSGRVHSALTDGDAPSCSTSPPTDNPQISTSKVQNKEQRRSAIFAGNSMIESSSHFVHDQNKYDAKVKHQPNSSKRIDQLEYRSTITDQLEGSSSATSYCLDTGSLHQNFPLPNLCLEGDQLHTTNNLPFADNIDGLAPDTLLSRAFDSGKDFQNLLSSYGGTPRDIETELSTAEISSQSFGVPDASFKPGCSNDVAVNETGVLGGDLWANQTQRMRTYTKVQKRGSVGRCIDVTHYRGYDDLRHELARMFGIEGQLEDPQRTEWKLVYVDHENDILLVGDDPWEEFVSCVQSIKILSSSEVQQMSLEDDMGQVPVSNQACSGTDSGTAWR